MGRKVLLLILHTEILFFYTRTEDGSERGRGRGRKGAECRSCCLSCVKCARVFAVVVVVVITAAVIVPSSYVCAFVGVVCFVCGVC